MGFAAGWSEVGTVCEGFHFLSSRSRWKAPHLPSSPHAENLHIPPQRLRPTAQLQTPPFPQKLRQHPQPRVAVCGEVKAAVRGSFKPAVCGEIQAAIRGFLKSSAVHGSLMAAVCGEVKAAVHGSFKTAIRGEIQATVRDFLKPAAVCGEVKAAVRGEIQATVRGFLKPATVCGVRPWGR